MLPYEIFTGDAAETLDRLAAERGAFATLMLTSPPYYGKRQYGGEDTPLNSFDALTFKRAYAGLWRSVALKCIDHRGALVICHDDSTARPRRPGVSTQPSASSMERRPHRDAVLMGGKSVPSTMRHGTWMMIPESIAAACSDNRAYAALHMEDLSHSEIAALLASKAPWILSEKLILSKANPFCESVQNRHAHSYEMVHVLRKSETYDFAYERAREPASHPAKEIALGRDGNRLRRDVLRCVVKPGRTGHPAPMPEDTVRYLIDVYSDPGDVVVDPFCGSGNIGEIAVDMGRKFVGVDISARYTEITECRCETAARRNQQRSTMEYAIHGSSA